MKVERQTKNPPPVWSFASDNLPPSLRAVRLEYGYGTVFGICAKVRGLRNMLKDPVARITDGCIEVYSPEYFSDFEDLARKYESKYKNEIIIKLWEEP